MSKDDDSDLPSRKSREITAALRTALMDYFCDVRMLMRMDATRTTYEYIKPHLPGVRVEPKKKDIWARAIQSVSIDGLMCEFGVFKGTSANFIASRMEEIPLLANRPLHVFDSWEGLPEDWATTQGKKGTFSLRGKIPELHNRIVPHQGWFDATIPQFAKEFPEPLAFVHWDGDLYSSAKCFFDGLGNHIRTGTVILFDNYFNYPNWELGEFKAFQEAVKQYGWNYKYLAFNASGRNRGQALVQIENVHR